MADVSCLIFARSPRGFLAAATLVAAAVSCSRYEWVERDLTTSERRILASETINGYVLADGEPKGNRSRYVVATEVDDRSVSTRISLPRYPAIPPGTFIRASGEFERAEAFETETGDVFDYPGFLRSRGTVALADQASAIIIEPDAEFSIASRMFASVIRYSSLLELNIVSATRDALGRKEAALVLGMTLGRKDDLDEQATEDFKGSGLMHIVVLSGSNVAIVVGAIATAVGRAPLGTSGAAEVVRSSAPIVGAWALVIMSGADPSARRAGIMATAAEFGRFRRRSVDDANKLKLMSRSKSSDCEPHTTLDVLLDAIAGPRAWTSLAVLTATAAAMAWLSPRAVVFDPSYQLSFLATVGVTFIAPVITRIARFLPERFGARETICQCVAAQIATFPIVSAMGGGQSWLALPANTIAAPLVPLAMASGAATGFVSMVSDVAAIPFAIVATASTHAVYAIAAFAAS